MATNSYIKTSNANKSISNWYIKSGGVTKKVKNGYIGSGGVAKKFLYEPQKDVSFSNDNAVWAYNNNSIVSYGGETIDTNAIASYNGTIKLNNDCYYVEYYTPNIEALMYAYLRASRVNFSFNGTKTEKTTVNLSTNIVDVDIYDTNNAPDNRVYKYIYKNSAKATILPVSTGFQLIISVNVTGVTKDGKSHTFDIDYPYYYYNGEYDRPMSERINYTINFKV